MLSPIESIALLDIVPERFFDFDIRGFFNVGHDPRPRSFDFILPGPDFRPNIVFTGGFPVPPVLPPVFESTGGPTTDVGPPPGTVTVCVAARTRSRVVSNELPWRTVRFPR